MIDIFNNKYFLNNRKCNIATIWLMFLVIFFLIFLNVFFNYRYKSHEDYLGYVKKIDNNFNLVIYMKEDKISEIINYVLKVEGIYYDFSIMSISDEFYILENENYYEVVLNVELDNKLLIENNIVKVVFEKNTTTLYNEFKKGMKKWLS